jgi:hypothetical protein
LAVAQGQIRVRPGTRKKHQGLCPMDTWRVAPWSRPAATPFPVEQVSDLIRR